MRNESNPRRVRVERGIYRSPKSGRYEIVYTDSDGRQRWQAAEGGLKAARHVRADVVVKLGRGERVAPAKLTVAELAEPWYAAKAARLRPGTLASYRKALDLVVLLRFGRWPLQRVDAEAVANLIRELEREGLHAVDVARAVRPLGRSIVENYLKPLQGTLALAARRRLIPASPFDALTVDDRPRRAERVAAHEWLPEEVEALLAASASLAQKREARFDYSPLLRLVALLGLRLGEVLGLQWGDFDKDEGVLHVRRQWLRSGEYGPTKTKAGVRRIALPADLRDELIALRLRAEFSLDEDPVFASLTGSPLVHRNVTRRGFEAAAAEAKLEGVSFHDLRHAAASRLIRGGLDPVTVADVLGHEDANTTLKVYGHLWDRRRTDEAVRVALAGSQHALAQLLQ